MSDSKPLLKTSPLRFHFKERRPLLIFGDTIVAILSLIGALYYWGSSEHFYGFSLLFIQRRVPLWFFLFPIVWLILLVELYDIYKAGDWGATIRGVATAGLIGFGLYLLLYFYYVEPPRSLLPRRGVAGFLVVVSFLTLFWRRLYIQIFTTPRFLRRVLLVGGGNTGQAMLNIYKALRPPPFYLIGIIDDDPEKLGKEIEGYKVLGSCKELRQIIQAEEVTDIIVAITGHLRSGMFQALILAQENGIEISSMQKVYEELVGRVPVQILEADWILKTFVDEVKVSGFVELSKRLLDILGGAIGMIVFLVLSPFIALAIFIDNGMPIFYSQARLGRSGRDYTILKFRTMKRDAEANGQAQWAKEDDIRATRVGRFLRKAHLDELPQFINILRGDMSLVGPRAERPELVDIFEANIPFYRARLLVKPGLTGWAQINFGYAASIRETTKKLEYDLYYIKNRSFWMDLVILLRTPATVLGFRGR
jgi:exopolysaccharide biosynthesis polyprenyl glycosylphosphotransferase